MINFFSADELADLITRKLFMDVPAMREEVCAIISKYVDDVIEREHVARSQEKRIKRIFQREFLELLGAIRPEESMCSASDIPIPRPPSKTLSRKTLDSTDD